MSARPPRSSVLPQGAWEEKAKEHIGSKSALAPPSEGKRRAARASGAGFKRAGWAALDEEVKAPKASSRSKKSATGSPASAASSSKKSTPSSSQSATSDLSADAGKKRPRELFPDAASSTVVLGTVEEGEEGEDGPGEVLEVVAVVDGDADDGGEGGGGEGGEGGGGEDGEGGAGEAEAAPVKKKRNRGKKHDEGDAKELKPRHLRGKKKEEAMARQAVWVLASEARKAEAAKRQGQPEEQARPPPLPASLHSTATTPHLTHLRHSDPLLHGIHTARRAGRDAAAAH